MIAAALLLIAPWRESLACRSGSSCAREQRDLVHKRNGELIVANGNTETEGTGPCRITMSPAGRS